MKRQGGCELKSFMDDCYDSHAGETYCQLNAYNTEDWRVGRIDYSIYKNKVYISIIQVDEDCRRKHIATRLMDELKRIHAGQKINTGLITSDGVEFFKRYQKRGVRV